MLDSRPQKAQEPPARQNLDLAKPQFKKSQNSNAVGDPIPTQNSRAVSVRAALNPNTALSLSTEARGMDLVLSSGIGGEAQASVPWTSAGTWFNF